MQNHQAEWDNRYLTHNTPWELGEARSAIKAAFLEYVPQGKAVLEIGCGAGTHLIWLAKNGYSSMLGSQCLEDAKPNAAKDPGLIVITNNPVATFYNR